MANEPSQLYGQTNWLIEWYLIGLKLYAISPCHLGQAPYPGKLHSCAVHAKNCRNLLWLIQVGSTSTVSILFHSLCWLCMIFKYLILIYCLIKNDWEIAMRWILFWLRSLQKWIASFPLSSLPLAEPTMRLSQESSRLPICLFFGRFTSPGSFWIFFPFRSSLT